MPAPRVCAQPGCPTLIEAGQTRCPTHRRPAWSGAGGQHGGADWHYRTVIRPAVLARDHYRCVDCGALAIEVDHLDRLADGGPLRARPDRLQSVCIPCHRRRELERRHQRDTR